MSAYLHWLAGYAMGLALCWWMLIERGEGES
jgi:hypothetical protein